MNNASDPEGKYLKTFNNEWMTNEWNDEWMKWWMTVHLYLHRRVWTHRERATLLNGLSFWYV